MYHTTEQIAENEQEQEGEARRDLVSQLGGMKYGGSLVFITLVTVKLGVFTITSSPILSLVPSGWKHIKGQKSTLFLTLTQGSLTEQHSYMRSIHSYEHLSVLTSRFHSFTSPHHTNYKTVNKLF